jgi:hypothetical protein
MLLPDGKPNPEASPNDQQELSKAMARHTNNHESAQKQLSFAKQKLSEIREKAQNMQNLVKNAQKNYSLAVTLLQKKQSMVNISSLSKSGRSEKKQTPIDDEDRASFRVKDVIGALRVTAERRRDQSDQKKNTGFSSAWVQSFPGLPSSLKKSLWHKMHRRKQQVILRPTPESLVTELRSIVARAIATKFSERSKSDKMEKIEAEMTKAEQLYLLATHPFSDEPLPHVPPTKSSENWAEPGWKLDLSVHNDDAYRASMILPCVPSFPVLESNLSEISSTPGRQAASMLRTSHFRCLSSPLSAFAVASSPAECSSTFSQSRVYVEGDPLHATDEDMLTGYTFAVKQQPLVKPSAPRRRTSAPKTQLDTDSNHGEYSASKRPSLSGSTVGNAPNSAEATASQAAAERKKSESKRRRNTAKESSPNPKKPKVDTTLPTTTSTMTSQQYSPIVQKHQSKPQAPSPSMQQRQPTQVRHPPTQVHPQQRQHVSQHQPILTQQPQQRQMHHPVSRHPSSQHHQQLSTSQHHPQMPSQHHPQHLPPHAAQQHPSQQHPSQHQHASQPQYSSPQMAQMRMMQQQGQQIQNMSPRHQQVAVSYPPQAIQQMQQFYTPLSHPPAPIHMQGRPVPPHPPQPPPNMPATGPSRKPDDPNDASDPLFMLK